MPYRQAVKGTGIIRVDRLLEYIREELRKCDRMKVCHRDGLYVVGCAGCNHHNAVTQGLLFLRQDIGRLQEREGA